jgi:hypothetical protein
MFYFYLMYFSNFFFKKMETISLYFMIILSTFNLSLTSEVNCCNGHQMKTHWLEPIFRKVKSTKNRRTYFLSLDCSLKKAHKNHSIVWKYISLLNRGVYSGRLYFRRHLELDLIFDFFGKFMVEWRLWRNYDA